MTLLGILTNFIFLLLLLYFLLLLSQLDPHIFISPSEHLYLVIQTSLSSLNPNPCNGLFLFFLFPHHLREGLKDEASDERKHATSQVSSAAPAGPR